MSGSLVLLIASIISFAAGGQTRPPNTSVRESTITATITRIEPGRVVTLKTDKAYQTVAVPEDLKEFDNLKVGDVATVRYTESVIVAVLRPGAKPTAAQDTTAEAQQANKDVIQQVKRTVTIEAIDPQGMFVNYRTEENVRALHAVRDKSLLEGLKVGDRVEITMTRARAVSIEPKR
jgi:Cu/Ag efflux protein CusF